MLLDNRKLIIHIAGFYTVTDLTAKFWFGANELDENNWVVDFGGLKGLKEKLKNQFDHTTCIAADDPALPIFQQN